MPYKKAEINKVYYSIGEVAEMLNVNASLIRFWEKEFNVLKLRKNSKGNRMFTLNDIEKLRLIHNLVKEKGYTLQGAREALRKDSDKIAEQQQLLKTLKDLKSFIQELLEKA